MGARPFSRWEAGLTGKFLEAAASEVHCARPTHGFHSADSPPEQRDNGATVRQPFRLVPNVIAPC